MMLNWYIFIYIYIYIYIFGKHHNPDPQPASTYGIPPGPFAQTVDFLQQAFLLSCLSWSRSFPGSSVRAAPGAEDWLTPGYRLSPGSLRHS